MGVLALAALSEQPFRFNALRRKIDGVSEKMLAQTLQALERDGFVHCEARPTIPPHVEYTLTPMGREVAGRLTALIEHVESLVPEVERARPATIAGSSGRPGSRQPGQPVAAIR